MNRRALVTGGAGFIGSHVTDLFIANGFDVTILDDFSSGKDANVNAAATVVRESIASPAAAALIRDGRFDVVAHLAAQIDVRKSVEDPAWDAAMNIGGSLNLLEAVRRSGHRTRFIFSSSGGAQYGDFVEMPTVETAAKDPQSPYGVAKLTVEYYMSYFARVHGLDTVALRYANVYGPRQDPHGEAGVVAIFCRRVLTGTPLTAYGDGLQTRDYVYVGDVARANLLAVDASLPAAGRLDDRGLNVGTGIETTVLDLANALQRAAGVSVPMQHADARAGEQRRSSIAYAKTTQVLGWKPEVSLHEGLKATLDYFRADVGGGRTLMPILALMQIDAQPTNSIIGLLSHGTPVSWAVLVFLLCLSAISWTIMAMKSREFRSVNSAARPLIAHLADADSFDDAAMRARVGVGSPFYAVMRRAERFMAETKPALPSSTDRIARLSQAQVEALQMVLDKETTAERDRLERLLPWLATIGAVSPLIGLLGTVLGVINAFLGVAASGSGNISAVAPGVAEALIATALALTVAIPAVFGYNFFASRLNHLTSALDAFSTDVVALLVRDGRI